MSNSQANHAAKPTGGLDGYFKISARGSSVRQEVVAGLTTFLAMVYSVIVVPSMLGKAGFPPAAVFVSTCLVAGLGSLLMGLWANLPMAIGCAISLTAFTAFSLVLGQHISIPVALGAVFVMGVLFTVISVTGIRAWILRNLPMGVAHGTGIGIGLFLLLIAANGVGLVVKNPLDGLPVALGAFTSFPVVMTLVGLAVIFGLEKLRVPGGILLVIIAISIIGLIVDPAVKYQGLFAMPSLADADGKSLIFSLDIMGALQPVVLPSVLALVMTAVFDATGTIRAVAGQANLLDKDGQIINGGKALTSDSLSSIFSGLVGAAPAAVYIESAAGTAAGGKTGLTATVVGILFDGGPGAGLFRQRGLLVGTDAADQARTQRFRPLAGDQPDAAGRGMEQKHFTRLHVIGLAQQVVYRQPFEERGCTLFKAKVARQQRHAFCRDVVDLAVGAERRLRIHHPVARFEDADPGADLGHHAGRFGAEAARQAGRRVQSAAHIGVDVVDADRLVLDLHFAGSRIERCKINVLQDFRPAGGGELNALGHVLPSFGYLNSPYAFWLWRSSLPVRQPVAIMRRNRAEKSRILLRQQPHPHSQPDKDYVSWQEKNQPTKQTRTKPESVPEIVRWKG